MSEENQVVAEQQDDVGVEKEVDIKALIAENEKLKADLKTVAEHKDKLYKETKQAKAEREAANIEAARIAEEKAAKDGEFEKLWSTAKQESEALKQQLLDMKNSNRKEKIQIAALRLSNELAEGDNVELLSEFVIRDLDKMADETGSLSGDVLDGVKKEFANNQKFRSLLRGSKATGGNALGNTSGKAQSKEISRADFDKMDQYTRGQFFATGGKLVD